MILLFSNLFSTASYEADWSVKKLQLEDRRAHRCIWNVWRSMFESGPWSYFPSDVKMVPIHRATEENPTVAFYILDATGKPSHVFKPSHGEFKRFLITYEKETGFPIIDRNHGLLFPVHPDTGYRREVAFSMLNDALGFNVVQKTKFAYVNGELGSVQGHLGNAYSTQYKSYLSWWKDHFRGVDDFKISDIEGVDLQQLEEMAVLDSIGLSMDRNFENWMIDQHGRVGAIDNSFSFPVVRHPKMQMTLSWVKPNTRVLELSKEVKAKILAFDEEKFGNDALYFQCRIERSAVELFKENVRTLKDLIRSDSHLTWGKMYKKVYLRY